MGKIKQKEGEKEILIFLLMFDHEVRKGGREEGSEKTLQEEEEERKRGREVQKDVIYSL